MLVVPGLAVPAGSSLFDLFISKISNIDTFLQNFYMIKNADFFVILLIQQICFGYMVNINQFPLLINYYMSPSFCFQMKKNVEKSISLLKSEFVIFPLGFSYASDLTCLSIVFIYSIHVPPILVLGVLYFFIQFATNAHLMLNIHREEIDSSFSIVHNACSKVISILIFFQICIFFNIIYSSSYGISGLLFLVIILTITFGFFFDKKFLRPEIFLDEEVELNSRHMRQWKDHFTHPSLKQNNNLDIQRMQTIQKIHRRQHKIHNMTPIDEYIELNMPDYTKSKVGRSQMSNNHTLKDGQLIQIYSYEESNQTIMNNNKSKNREYLKEDKLKPPEKDVNQRNKKQSTINYEMFDVFNPKYDSEEKAGKMKNKDILFQNK